MVPFHKATSGRIVLLAAAVFLLTGAAYLEWDSLTALGIGMPAGITVAFIGVGLGIRDYGRETILGICLLPPALWGFMFFIPYTKGSTIWPMLIGAAGLVFAAVAALPGAGAATTSGARAS